MRRLRVVAAVGLVVAVTALASVRGCRDGSGSGAAEWVLPADITERASATAAVRPIRLTLEWIPERPWRHVDDGYPAHFRVSLDGLFAGEGAEGLQWVAERLLHLRAASTAAASEIVASAETPFGRVVAAMDVLRQAGHSSPALLGPEDGAHAWFHYTGGGKDWLLPSSRLPRSRTASLPPDGPGERIIITIDSEGTASLASSATARPRSAAAAGALDDPLRSALKGLLGSENEAGDPPSRLLPTVRIRAAAATPWKYVSAARFMCAEVGLTRIEFAVLPSRSR